MLSLEEGSASGMPAPDEEGLEFNAYTLTGENHALFVALLRFVEEQTIGSDALDDENLLSLLRSHIHRGIGTLGVRTKTPLDVARLARVG